MSQTITPTPVLPVRGPAGFHQFSAFFRSAETSARFVASPMTKTPTAAARIAAAAGPLGFSAIIFVPPYPIGAILLRKAPNSPPSPAGRREGHDEEPQDGAPYPFLARQLRSVVGHDEGDRRRQDRGEPADVLLPLHAEGVPGGRSGLGEEEEAGEEGQVGVLRRPGAVPGIDDVGAAEDGDPGDQGHHPGPGGQAADTFAGRRL